MEIIDHPAYYGKDKIEAIDFIEAHGLNFSLGNAVKYIMRAGNKPNEDSITALKKPAGISTAKYHVSRKEKIMLSEDMIKRLIAAGISKQQANSTTADVVANFFMNEDEKTLIREARIQVNEMYNLVADLRVEFSSLKKKIEETAGFLLDIAEAQEKHGAITDERAKNAVALYATLLSMNERAGAKGSDSVNNAGYVTYAYLGGQARRDIHYDKLRDDDD